jgi:small subunit ribosomal protein S17
MSEQVTTVATRIQRRSQTGMVTSDERDRTIRVQIDYRVRHPKYGKYMRRRTVVHAHDEKNEAHKGDWVEIVECRPISKTKNWRLVRILGTTKTSSQ